MISTSGDLGASDGNASCPLPLMADFPSSSPYTTSLGATLLHGDATEAACSLLDGAGFTTGGMFSTHFAQPKYQQVQCSGAQRC